MTALSVMSWRQIKLVGKGFQRYRPLPGFQTWLTKFPVNEIAMTSEGWRKTSLTVSEGLSLMQPRQFSLKMQRELATALWNFFIRHRRCCNNPLTPSSIQNYLTALTIKEHGETRVDLRMYLKIEWSSCDSPPSSSSVLPPLGNLTQCRLEIQ